VRWGGTRKGSATFYTRPALAVPTAIRTLEPLVYTRRADGTRIPKRPEEILALVGGPVGLLPSGLSDQARGLDGPSGPGERPRPQLPIPGGLLLGSRLFFNFSLFGLRRLEALFPACLLYFLVPS